MRYLLVAWLLFGSDPTPMTKVAQFTQHSNCEAAAKVLRHESGVVAVCVPIKRGLTGL